MLFLDSLTLLLVTVFALGVSGAAGVADWMLNHLALVFFLLVLKSLLVMGSGFFKENNHPSYYIALTLIILADMVRNGVFVYFASILLSELFSGSFFEFIFEIFALLIGGPMLFLASEGPMYIVYDMMDDPGPTRNEPVDMSTFWLCIGLEALSIVAMLSAGVDLGVVPCHSVI